MFSKAIVKDENLRERQRYQQTIHRKSKVKQTLEKFICLVHIVQYQNATLIFITVKIKMPSGIQCWREKVFSCINDVSFFLRAFSNSYQNLKCRYLWYFIST